MSESTPLIQPKSIFQKNKIVYSFCIFISGGLIVLGLVYADLVLRARHAYFEGEKYFNWYKNPSEKVQFFNLDFETKKKNLDSKLAEKKLSQEQYQFELEMLQFDRDFHLTESPLKYSYQWYRDAVELFNPPESKWVKLSKEKLPQVLSLWKDELREKKIPFDDKTFE